MKKILIFIVGLFYFFSASAGYDVTLGPTGAPNYLDPGTIIISSGGYDEVISPWQSLETSYTFDYGGANIRYLCKQIAIINNTIECRSDQVGYPIIFPLGALPYYIFDEREEMNPTSWTKVSPPTPASSGYVTFSGGVMTVTAEGQEAGRDSVQDGIAMAFGILAFLGIYALALGGKFVLNFVMALPNKVFGGGKQK